VSWWRHGLGLRPSSVVSVSSNINWKKKGKKREGVEEGTGASLQDRSVLLKAKALYSDFVLFLQSHSQLTELHIPLCKRGLFIFLQFCREGKIYVVASSSSLSS